MCKLRLSLVRFFGTPVDGTTSGVSAVSTASAWAAASAAAFLMEGLEVAEGGCVGRALEGEDVLGLGACVGG